MGSGLIALMVEEIQIDKQADDRVMNYHRFGKTNCPSS